MRKKLTATVAAVALAAFAFAAPAGAAGGKGASSCSTSGKPDGFVDGSDIPGTVDNPGEAFSFFAPQNVFAKDPATNPGQQVKATCNPTPQVDGES